MKPSDARLLREAQLRFQLDRELVRAHPHLEWKHRDFLFRTLEESSPSAAGILAGADTDSGIDDVLTELETSYAFSLVSPKPAQSAHPHGFPDNWDSMNPAARMAWARKRDGKE